MQLIQPKSVILEGSPIPIAPSRPILDDTPFDLFAEWDQAIIDDTEYTLVLRAVYENKQKIPPELSLKLSIAECGI